MHMNAALLDGGDEFSGYTVNMKISYDAAQLSSRKVAPICIWIDGRPFPSANWTDFLPSIMTAWLENVLALSASPRLPPPMQNRYQLTFIDGPWAVLIDEGPTKDQVALVAVEKVPASHVSWDIEFQRVAHETVLRSVLQQSILDAARGVLRYCKQEKLHPRVGDVAALEHVLALHDARTPL
ncbi:MAG: hypothetical protein U0271_35230 [Polyangiaceae bacterium]